MITRSRKIRIAKGLSQAELARKAGINQSSLYRIEHGLEPAFPKRGKKIADVLGWTDSLDRLFELVEGGCNDN